ncbi:MAG: TIGR03000 domain-containing protein [Thermoguttaceae bacterium]|nr:TIGR03000 domain-containing protein [Thermoguttaceae bacterium]
MKTLKFVVLSMLVLCVFGMGQSAFGFFPFRPWLAPSWGGPYWGYPVYDYGWYDPCCAPVVEPCCAPVAATPVVSTPVAAAPVDCCGPVVSYGYPTGYYLGWRPGPIRRLLFGRYRWYATGYVGGYYYTPDCCDPAYDATPIESAPAAAPAPTPAPTPAPAPVPAEETSSILSSNAVYHQTAYTQPEATHENSGIISISVPEDAVVYVNDIRTTATGTNRSFVSFGLQSGNEYDYVIRAEVMRNGQTYVETKIVTLKAGQKDAVAFAFPEIVNPTEQVVAL